ncbi:MAG: AEC family transporter [Lachnospiraceae bacterium]|nr:AEC family transporter [Lachnospiraceae bacterium]
MDSFIYSLNATVPVFLVMLIGSWLKRRGILTEQFVSAANKFVFQIALPAKLLLDLAETDIIHSFDIRYIGFCFGVTLLSILTIWYLAKKLLKDPFETGAFVQASYRSSAAILGVAFIENIYGNSGMAPLMMIGAVPLYNIFAVIVLTFENTDNHAKGNERIVRAAKGVATNPIILSIAAGILLSLMQISFPPMIDKTIRNLGVMASPLALLAIGAGFEGRKALAKIKTTAAAATIKLVLLTAIFLPVAVALGFRDQKLLALIIMLGSPTTPTAYIMAKNMGGDGVLSSSVIVLTTLLSAVTLTFWIFLVRSMGLVQ